MKKNQASKKNRKSKKGKKANKLLVILGPTATGKSDLAIYLAKLFNGEIISADSRQIYKGLNLGSGKVPLSFSKTNKNNTSPKLATSLKPSSKPLYSQGVRHHLIDICHPQDYFSAAQYQKSAYQTINKINQRNRLPILCGGTALYIVSICEGWQFPKVKPNQQLRQQLEQIPLSQLAAQLKKIDPNRAKNIDLHNKRRVIRALEILAQQNQIVPLIKKSPPYDIFIVGLKTDKTRLKKMIKKRLDHRLKQGMIEEVKNLKKLGVTNDRLEKLGLVYRWVNRYLENQVSYQEMKQQLLTAIWHFAKRQMTWFKKIPKVYWITTSKIQQQQGKQELNQKIQFWLNGNKNKITTN